MKDQESAILDPVPFWPMILRDFCPQNAIFSPLSPFSPIQPTLETLGLLASLLTTLLGMALWWLLLALALLLLLLALLHRPLPAGIADRKKIALFEFLMRLTNEYLVRQAN